MHCVVAVPVSVKEATHGVQKEASGSHDAMDRSCRSWREDRYFRLLLLGVSLGINNPYIALCLVAKFSDESTKVFANFF